MATADRVWVRVDVGDLAKSADARKRRQAARCSGVPEDLDRLSRDRNLMVRMGVGENVKAPLEVLARLSHDRDPNVRAALLQNPAVPWEVLAPLAQDPVVWVRVEIAAAAITPADCLAGLASDPASEVRFAVASNQWAPGEVLEVLSRDRSPKVRAAVAVNVSTPTEVLARLFLHQSGKVRWHAARRAPAWATLHAFTDAYGSGAADARRALAAAGRCRAGGDVTQAVLGLGDPGRAGARRALAAVTDDVDLARVLADDGDERVRQVARWRMLELS